VGLIWPRFTLTLFRIRNSNRHPANLTNTSMWQRGFSSLPPSFVYSQMLPSLFHRHPNGGCANFLLAHSREAILLPFILSPILCLPTYFVFQVRETYDVDKVNSEAMYHVYFDKDSVLYRWVQILNQYMITSISSKGPVKLHFFVFYHLFQV